MKITRNKEVEQAYRGNITSFLNGRRLPPLALQKRNDEDIHKSDILNCILPKYYEMTTKEKPQWNDTSAMNFAIGRMFEYLLAFQGELSPKNKDFITVTADDMYKGVLTEIKYTRETLELFDPRYSHVEWVKGMMAECSAFDTLIHHLLVGFPVGNLQSKTFFGAKLHKEALIPASREWITNDIQAYTFEFEQSELDSNWKWMNDKAAYLLECIRTTTPPSRSVVNEILMDETWKCKNCEWQSEYCYYWNDFVKEIKK